MSSGFSTHSDSKRCVTVFSIARNVAQLLAAATAGKPMSRGVASPSDFPRTAKGSDFSSSERNSRTKQQVVICLFWGRGLFVFLGVCVPQLSYRGVTVASNRSFRLHVHYFWPRAVPEPLMVSSDEVDTVNGNLHASSVALHYPSASALTGTAGVFGPYLGQHEHASRRIVGWMDGWVDAKPEKLSYEIPVFQSHRYSVW